MLLIFVLPWPPWSTIGTWSVFAFPEYQRFPRLGVLVPCLSCVLCRTHLTALNISPQNMLAKIEMTMRCAGSVTQKIPRHPTSNLKTSVGNTIELESIGSWYNWQTFLSARYSEAIYIFSVCFPDFFSEDIQLELRCRYADSWINCYHENAHDHSVSWTD